MPRKGGSLFVPLACAVPPMVAYMLHVNHDSRELAKDEITRSHTLLAGLSPSSSSRGGIDRQYHLKNLIHNGGITVLPKVLDQINLKRWNDNLQDSFNNKDSKVGRSSSSIRSNRGRLHSHQESRKDQYHHHFLNLIESLPELQSLVGSYFEQYSIQRYQLTQIQFLLAKPGSQHQIWHRDNIAPGLTLLIALKDVTGNGPTELILGSHLDGYKIFNGKNEIVLGCLGAGDAILYDARVIHRGRGFEKTIENAKDGVEEMLREYEDRPVLILRWDSTLTPPPGAGIIVTNIVDYVGSIRVFVTEARGLIDWLFENSRAKG